MAKEEKKQENEEEKRKEETVEKKSGEESAGKEAEKKEKTKKTKEEKPKKTEAFVRAKDLPISTKHAMAICRFIKNKKIEDSIKLLEGVMSKKIAVPFRGEIPHRKGMIMSGRYPVKASKCFVELLKSLYANASVAGLDLDKVKITPTANQASRPYKRFGSTRFKRTHVVIKAK